MTLNLDYINQVKVSGIQWHRLTTPCGRADAFPDLFNQIASGNSKACDLLASLVEHQCTLWHATPFALVFLCRILQADTVAPDMKVQILKLLNVIAEAIEYNLEGNMGGEKHLDCFSDMLQEKYLWSEIFDEHEDELRYEKEPFTPELDCSFYFFSLAVLKNHVMMFAKLEGGENSGIRDLAMQLNSTVKSLAWQPCNH